MSDAETASGRTESMEAQQARQAERKLEKQHEARDLVGRAEENQTVGAGIQAAKELRNAAWKSFCEGMEVSPADIKSQGKAEIIWGVVNLAYMLVIVGCELDLYGFGMSFQGYWELGEEFPFLRWALGLGPLGYMLATCMYMNMAQDENEKATAKAASQQAHHVPIPGVSQSGGQASTLIMGPGTAVAKKKPIELQLYHFLPIFRYYLVIKEKTEDDVEGVFRANSLSSFTLGIPQICGICFMLHKQHLNFRDPESWQQVSMFTWINISSQVINWTITIIYFLTPVASRMAGSIKVEAMVYNVQKRLQEKYEQYLQIVQSGGGGNDAEQAGLMQDLQRSQKELEIDNEIKALSKLDSKTDLTLFTIEQKLLALKYLHKRQCTVYAEI